MLQLEDLQGVNASAATLLLKPISYPPFAFSILVRLMVFYLFSNVIGDNLQPKIWSLPRKCGILAQMDGMVILN